MKIFSRRALMAALGCILALLGWARDHDFYAATHANYSTGNFSPYYIGSMSADLFSQKSSAYLIAGIGSPVDLKSRFSWGYKVEGLTGYFSKADYQKWNAADKQWLVNPQGPSAARLQQLYAEIKYRGVFVTAGMKHRSSALLSTLSSGDLIESGNARPIPEVRAGFIDFQSIPFTNGWVQIQGEISYGKMADNSYMKHHFNYYSYHLNLGSLYNYKRCYFRTKPTKPFSVTVGMQVGAFFGGETSYYEKGQLVRTQTFSESLKTFFKMFLPMGENGEDNYVGSQLGTWDLMARYRLKGGDEIKAYFQWPWEDGSSIGRRNGWDGLWGIQYTNSDKQGYVGEVVIEYLDFRNQCGPIHWMPQNTPGTTIANKAGGRDNYYNNSYYNAYANFGMAIGTPFLVSPIYNLDGFPAFVSNRANGFHLGVKGKILPDLTYGFKFGYQRGLGRYDYSFAKPKTSTSMMLSGTWHPHSEKNAPWSFFASIAFDKGDLRGDNFGFMLGVRYHGKISEK